MGLCVRSRWHEHWFQDMVAQVTHNKGADEDSCCPVDGHGGKGTGQFFPEGVTSSLKFIFLLINIDIQNVIDGGRSYFIASGKRLIGGNL